MHKVQVYVTSTRSIQSHLESLWTMTKHIEWNQ